FHNSVIVSSLRYSPFSRLLFLNFIFNNSGRIMSHDESVLSNAGGTQAHLIKVLANVVETQKSVATQFSALFDKVEEARNETRRNVQALTEEIKRLETRSNTMFEKVTTQLMNQNENLAAAHAVERTQWREQNDAQFAAHAAERAAWSVQNENLLNLVKTTIGAAPRPAAAQQVFTPSPMLGFSAHDQQLMEQFNQLTPNQIGALQMQMRQLQMQQQQQQMMARTVTSTPTAAPPVPPSSISTIPSIVPSVPAPVTAAPAAPKVEVKPVAPTPAPPPPSSSSSTSSTIVAPKPLFSFGTPATATKPLFGAPSTTPSTTPFSFSTPKPAINTEVKEEPADDENDEDHVEEYEPDVQFTPVIPLPDMIEVKTGEEAEKVVLEDRCKLFRYTNGEWKERATGSLKILKNEQTGKHRVVVRRDQVHKVAANFYLSQGVKIAPMKNNPKAVVWICNDFSEDEVNGMKEQLSAKFASPEKAEIFMDTANEIVDSAPKTGATPKKTEEKKGAKVDIPKAEEKKDDPPATGFGDKFKMSAGEWECTACYVRNPADATTCSCCDTANPACERALTDKPVNPFGKNASIFNPAAASSSTGPKISFGFGGASTTPAAPTETKTSTPSASTFSFGGAASAAPAAATTTAAPKFSFMQAAAAANKEDDKPKPLFGTSSSTSNAAFGAGATPTGTTAATFSFKTAASVAPSPSTFSFKTPDPSKPSSIFGGSQKTLFGTSNPSTPVDAKKEEEKKDTPGTIFGSTSFMGGQSTSTGFSALSGKPSIFEQQDKVAEGQKNFASLAKSKPFGQSAAVAAASNEDDDEDGDQPDEYEPDVEFTPVIPLPDLVEVKTGEEDEKVLFTARSKIFRYVRETKEYKERGVGDLKLLHNETTNKFRVVMRRDQVHKLCANFPVLKDAKVTDKAGQPNVRSIIVTDFAENLAGDMENFCIKFKNAEIAKEFENAFHDAQAQLQ
ncbi:hypothetical protein PRIPAC_72941, partial [Pristionchus pacificus]